MDGDSANVFSMHWFLCVNGIECGPAHSDTYDGGSSYEDRRAHFRRTVRSFRQDVRSRGARRDETLSLKYDVEKQLEKHIFVPLY